MSPTPMQRFIAELRRRHVPRTAAIYLVAAWAAIEFADVVVPNLNGPQWVVTAVIVAALVGFPMVLVLAWIFDWGPEGLQRTDDATDRMEAPPTYDAETGELEPAPAATATPPDRTRPWLAVVSVLVVGIGSALAVAFVLQGGGAPESAAPAADSARSDVGPEPGARPDAGRGPALPPVPEVPAMIGEGLGDSLRTQILRSFGELDSLDLKSLTELARRASASAGIGILISEPDEWRIGMGPAPAPLAEGDTLRVEGAAHDTAGVVTVTVDGDTVAGADPPASTLRFATALVGRTAAGTRTVVITARTADGREIRREYQVIQLPGGTP